MRTAWARFVAPLLFVLAAGLALAEVAVPPVARVTDLTGTLTTAQQQLLAEKLAALELRKGSQVAVLLLPTTQPETIEQFGIRVAEQWKLGRKGVDDGALLLVAKDDRAVRIEVGYGLEGVLNDATAKRIIDEIVVPRFRDGDFAGGIEAGVDRMIAVIDGEPLPPPEASRVGEYGVDGELEQIILIGFIVVLIVGGILRATVGKVPGATVAGAGAGVLAWLLAGSVLFGIVMAIVGFLFILGGGGLSVPTGGRHGGWGGGGWSSGGGGWRGGGGSFGGGGGSGRW
jgi:uncharacterized protein